MPSFPSMWRTDTLWFDAAVVLGIFAFGNILFGHFVQHEPKWRRLGKTVLISTVVLVLSATVGRIWAFGLLAVMALGAIYVHAFWLPKHGINGWTGEPRERYIELVTKRRGPRRRPPA